MVQLFVTHFSDKSSSYETELAEPPKRQHGEKSHFGKRGVRFISYCLCGGIWWRIEQKSCRNRDQPGFVPPFRLGTNQSERIATETKELTAARLARFSAVNT